MKRVLAYQLEVGKAYRSPEGDLLLITGSSSSSAAGKRDISFVWLGSTDEQVARLFLGQEHTFEAGPGNAWEYEEL